MLMLLCLKISMAILIWVFQLRVLMIRICKKISIDLSNIAKDITGTNSFSISRVGNAFMFTIGQMGSSDDSSINYYGPAGMHDYLVIYSDGSVSCRILLFSSDGGDSVDISVLPIMMGFYEDIYKTL